MKRKGKLGSVYKYKNNRKEGQTLRTLSKDNFGFIKTRPKNATIFNSEIISFKAGWRNGISIDVKFIKEKHSKEGYTKPVLKLNRKPLFFILKQLSVETLRKNNEVEKAHELKEKIEGLHSYDKVVEIIKEYIDLET